MLDQEKAVINGKVVTVTNGKITPVVEKEPTCQNCKIRVNKFCSVKDQYVWRKHEICQSFSKKGVKA